MCASRKKLRLFCSCFPHHFFYCTSCPILCSAGFPERAGKCFKHCTCAKALGPSTSSAKTGWRRAGFFFSPATTCWAPWASCVFVWCCDIAGGLRGGERCGCCSTFCSGCGLVICTVAPWALQTCSGCPALLGYFFL